MRLTEIKPVLVKEFPKWPEEFKEGEIYVKNDGPYRGSFHLCPCGCGEPVYLEYGPRHWDLKLRLDGDKAESITVSPSIYTPDYKCQSHYFIRDNKIVWV